MASIGTLYWWVLGWTLGGGVLAAAVGLVLARGSRRFRLFGARMYGLRIRRIHRTWPLSMLPGAVAGDRLLLAAAAILGPLLLRGAVMLFFGLIYVSPVLLSLGMFLVPAMTLPIDMKERRLFRLQVTLASALEFGGFGVLAALGAAVGHRWLTDGIAFGDIMQANGTLIGTAMIVAALLLAGTAIVEAYFAVRLKVAGEYLSPRGGNATPT